MHCVPSGRQCRRQPVRASGRVPSPGRNWPEGRACPKPAQRRGHRALFSRRQRRDPGAGGEADGMGAARSHADRRADRKDRRLSADADWQLSRRTADGSCAMKTTAAAIIAILAALLTWFSARAFNPEAELFDQALAELSRFGMIENALLRDIFAARTGMLRNYDPLVQETESLRESLSRLRSTTSAIDAAFVPQTDQLAGAVERQEQTVEQFKTENALLQNSLAFFGRFAPQSAEPLDPAISATVAAILRLSFDTSSATADDVEARLTALDRQSKETSGPTDTINVLLAHGRLLTELLPSVDGTLRRLRALPLKPHQDALRRAILAEQLASRTSARQFRWLLYGTSLLLVIFLGYLARRLKSRADALRRQAAFEHIITGISMRFINTTPRTLDADVDQALAELAEFIGPDRAYFVMAGP